MSDSEQKIAYHLSFRDVIRILRRVDESPFQEMQLELGDLKVRVMREHGVDAPVQSTGPAATHFIDGPTEAAEERTNQLSSATSPMTRADSDGTSVLAPLAGTFYRSPYPGEPPFVEVGSVVKEGDVVGILEIMKLMNYVVAPCSGVIREICAENEEFVEFGQVLAVIEAGNRCR